MFYELCIVFSNEFTFSIIFLYCTVAVTSLECDGIGLDCDYD